MGCTVCNSRFRTADTLRLKSEATDDTKRGTKGGKKNKTVDDAAQPRLSAFFGGQTASCDPADKITSNGKRLREKEESGSAKETVKSEAKAQPTIPVRVLKYLAE